MLITSERRGCPVKDCTKYIPGKAVARLARFYAGVGELSEQDRKLLELYDQGLSDSEMARQVNRSRCLIQHWRAKIGLPSNFSKEDDDED